MGRAVYIVGVNHCWQQLFGSPSLEDPKSPLGLREITHSEFNDFDNFIRGVIATNGIKTILEEAVGSPHLRISKLATELRKEHKFCECPKGEREKRGIKTSSDREKYWLSMLKTVNQFPVLTICGSNHVHSFKNLLCESNYEAGILVDDYETTILYKK